MNASTGRRRHGFAPRRDGIRYPQLMAVLAVALYFVGCTTTLGPTPAPAPAPPIGSSANLLNACGGADLGACRAFVVAILDHDFERGLICSPPDVTLDAIVAVAVEALRGSSDEEAHRVVADALIARYPCASAPRAPLTTTATDLPPLVTRLRRMENDSWLAF